MAHGIINHNIVHKPQIPKHRSRRKGPVVHLNLTRCREFAGFVESQVIFVNIFYINLYITKEMNNLCKYIGAFHVLHGLYSMQLLGIGNAR